MSKINTNQATFADWVALIDEELIELDNEGMEPETCKVIAIRSTDRLVEGESKGGDTVRGWLLDGESVKDIRWNWEEVDGWPSEVAV